MKVVFSGKDKLLKNPLTILQSEAVFLALKKLWVNNHINVKDSEKLVGDFFIFLASLKNEAEVKPRKIRDYYAKLLTEHKMADINTDFKTDMLVQLVEKDLEGAETVLDFGCGKLAFLKNIAAQNKNIQKMIGVDPQSRPVLADLDPRISFERSLETVAEASVDLAIVKLVLHHIGSDDEILEILENIKKVLRPGGKLIIFEESYLKTQKTVNKSTNKAQSLNCHPGPASGGDPGSNEDLGLPQGIRFRVKPGMTDIDRIILDTKKYLTNFGLELAEEATEAFLNLSIEEKKRFLFLNDWLMNLQNKYMPWTGEYKSMEEWTKPAEAAGFKNTGSHFIGAIKKRKRKQGMTVIMIFGN